MEIRLARILSYLFHPLLMPTLGIFLFFQLGTYYSNTVSTRAVISILSMVFLNTFIIPAVLTYFMYRKKIIPSMHLREREDRLLPFFLAFLFFAFNYLSFKRLTIPWPLYSLMLGSAVAVLFAFIISLKWKISIHMVGIGGIVGGIYGISQVFFPNTQLVLAMLALSIMLSGFVGFARLRLNAHNPLQVYAGFLLGFVCEFMPIFWRWG